MNTLSGGGQILIVGMNDVVINSSIGPDSVALDLLRIESLQGTLSVNKESGWLVTDALMELSGSTVDIAGVVKNLAATPAADDYEISIIASDTVNVSSDMESVGSVLIDAGNNIAIFNAGIEVTGVNEKITIISGDEITFGKVGIADNHPTLPDGQRYQMGAVIIAPGAVEIDAGGLVEIASAVQILTSQDGSTISIDAGDLSLVGSLYAGAELDDQGAVNWVGQSADIEIVVTEMMTVGGIGVDDQGNDVTRGGSAQATGVITVNVAGGSSGVSLSLNELSFLRTDATGDGAFATPPAPSAINIDTDHDIQILGLVESADDNSDITMNAGGLVTLDGFVQADDQLTITGGDDSSGMSILLPGFFFQTDGQGHLVDENGRLIDDNGFLIDENGNYVDESGDPIPPEGNPVPGGAPVRLSGGTLNTGINGEIFLSGIRDILLSGVIGQLRNDSGFLVADVAVVDVSTTGNIIVDTGINAINSIAFNANDISALANAVIKTRGQTSQITFEAVGNIFIARGENGALDALVETADLIHFFAGTIRVDGMVRNKSGAARILFNAVSDITVTGLVESPNSIEFNAGVGSDWTEAQLIGGGITVNDLIGGTILISDSGRLDAGGDLLLTAGYDVILQAEATLQDGQIIIPQPVITNEPTTIEVVTGSRQVADGFIFVPVVNWVMSTVTEQVGTEEVKIGTLFHTMDVTLTQDGYYKVNAPEGSKLREYFIENIDYYNDATAPTNIAGAAPGTGTLTQEVKIVDWSAYGADQPLSDATFTELNDVQRYAVIDTLGYLRLYDFSFANAREHNAINGIPTTTAWTPDWAGNPTAIYRIYVAGWSDKYIRMPVGAHEDVLRVVSQGEPQTWQEHVGQYRDHSLTEYYQDKSAYNINGYVGYRSNSSFYKQYLNSDENPFEYWNDWDNSPVRWEISYLSSGNREFSINDGRLVGSESDPDINGNSVSFIRIPEWDQSGNYENDVNDLNNTNVMVQTGYRPDTFMIYDSTHVKTRNLEVGHERYGYSPRYYALVDTGSFSDARTDANNYSSRLSFLAQPMTSAQASAVISLSANDGKQSWIGVKGEGDSHNDFYYDQGGALTGAFNLYWNSGGPSGDSGAAVEIKGWGWNDAKQGDDNHMIVQIEPTWAFNADIGENFKDYNKNWTSLWHDVYDTRLTLNYQWVSTPEEVYGRRPKFETYDAQVKVVDEKPVTQWNTEPITEEQLEWITNRLLEDGPARDFGLFETESLRAPDLIAINAGGNVALSGLVNAFGSEGEISIGAGGNVTVEGLVKHRNPGPLGQVRDNWLCHKIVII